MKIRTQGGVYHVYIVTNKERTTLEVGATGDLETRLYDLTFKTIYGHSRQKQCSMLLHCESFADVKDAIKREAALKRLSFRKKKELVSMVNPEWRFLNNEVQKDYYPFFVY